MLEQAAAPKLQGRHGGYFGVGQFVQEAVFLKNGTIAPAGRAVKLGDQRCATVHAHLIDPVFVAIEGEQPAIAGQAGRFDCREHKIGGQGGEGQGIVHQDLPPVWPSSRV